MAYPGGGSGPVDTLTLRRWHHRCRVVEVLCFRLTRAHVIHHGKKLARIIGGGVLVLVGAALSVPGVPGPGIAVVILGLSVLSTDFEFARRAMEWLKDAGRRAINRVQKNDPSR